MRSRPNFPCKRHRQPGRSLFRKRHAGPPERAIHRRLTPDESGSRQIFVLSSRFVDSLGCSRSSRPKTIGLRPSIQPEPQEDWPTSWRRNRARIRVWPPCSIRSPNPSHDRGLHPNWPSPLAFLARIFGGCSFSTRVYHRSSTYDDCVLRWPATSSTHRRCLSAKSRHSSALGM